MTHSNDDHIVKSIDSYLKAAETAWDFSGSVLLARGSEILFKGGYGFSFLDNRNTAKTVYNIASLSMQLTAIALLKLQEEGAVSLDDPIGKFLPYIQRHTLELTRLINDLEDRIQKLNEPIKDGEFIPRHRLLDRMSLIRIYGERVEPLKDSRSSLGNITLENLLNHTSGIVSYETIPEYKKYQRERHSPLEISTLFQDLPLENSPGTVYKVSYSAYNLIGLIIQAVSGQPYEEYLQEHILAPLDMTRTGLGGFDVKLPDGDRAIGHRINSKGKVVLERGHNNNSYYHGFSARGLFSSVEDLFHLHKVFEGKKLLNPTSRAALFYDNYAWKVAYGVDDKQYHFIRGEIKGFQGFLSYFNFDKTLIIVLSNQQNFPSSKIAYDLSKLLFDHQIPSASYPSKEVNSDEYESLLGEYQLIGGSLIQVWKDRKHNILLLFEGETDPIKPIPLSERRFLSPNGDEFSFECSASSEEIDTLFIFSNGIEKPISKAIKL